MAAALDQLLARRVDKIGDVPLSAGDVLRWSEAHRVRASRHWPGAEGAWVAPPAMVTSLLRPLEWRPDRERPPADRGSTLHEELKAALGLPLGIAAGYELELHALLGDGDRVAAVERIASVGEPEVSRLGPGRRWVVENEIRRVAASRAAGTDDLVAVERFLMLGYDPAATAPSDRPDTAPPPPTGSVRDPGGDGANHGVERVGAGEVHVEELEVTAVVIVMGASANRVWTPAHIDRDAANAAGIADVFLDTSTQLGLLSVVGGRAAHPDARPGRLSLRMRRPIVAGDVLRMEATVGALTPDAVGVAWVDVDVRASVGGELRSSLRGRFAVPAPRAIEPWELSGDAWRP